MDLMNLGKMSRKTGLKAKQNSRRESNGMEELNDFFQEGSDSDNDVKPPNNDAIARKLTFQKQTYKSPRRSHARDNDDDVFAPASPPAKRKSNDFLKKLETLSPITSATTRNSPKKQASVTKKMALGKGKKAKQATNGNSNKDLGSGKKKNLFGSDDDDDDDDNHNNNEDEDDDEEVKPIIQNGSLVRGKKRRSLREAPEPAPPSSPELSPPSPPSVQPSPGRPPKKQPRQAPKKQAKKAADLPEPGIRRSSRHRTPALAFWRNEKIVYKTTKENGAVVREVDNIIQIPEPNPDEQKRSRRASSAQASSTTRAHRKSRGSKLSALASEQEDDDEPEEEPDLEGSEWYKTGNLSLDVYEGPGSDNKVSRVIAWTPKGENYASKETTSDKFNLAVLFDQDREFAAAGMLELPLGGVKAMRDNDDTYFMFHVVSGVLEITINDSKFIAAKGCSFEVPMGNMYQLQNKGKTLAKLFFVQAKYVTIDPNEEWD